MPYFEGLDKLKLRYTDVLTYVAIRSFRNDEDYSCFPSYETVGKVIGASRDFIFDSAKRLIATGLISKVNRYRTSNVYGFKSADRWVKIPPQVLTLDLSIYEKAMLILIRQLAEGTPVLILKDITTIAARLGVTYKTVYTQVQALIKKGYLVEVKNGKKFYNYYKLTDKVDWYYKWDFPTSRQNDKEENDKEDYVLIIP